MTALASDIRQAPTWCLNGARSGLEASAMTAMSRARQLKSPGLPRQARPRVWAQHCRDLCPAAWGLRLCP